MLKEYKNELVPLLKKIREDKDVCPSKELYIDITGSRISGKNQAVEEFCCLAMCLNDSVGVEAFRFMNKDKEELDNNLRDAFERIHAMSFLNRQKYYMQIKKNYMRVEGVFTQNREKVKLAGRYQPYKKYKIIFIDEFFEFTHERYFLDIYSAIRNYDNLIVIRIANPWLETHWWVHPLYYFTREEEAEFMYSGWKTFNTPNHIVIWCNWRINSYLPEAKREHYRLMEINNPQRARVESFGLPGSLSGSIYGDYLNDISGLLQPSSFFVGGLDYGHVRDAMTCCLLGTDTQFNNINYIDEYYYDPLGNVKKSIPKLAEEIIVFYMNLANKYPLIKKGLVIYCDSAERSFISRLNEEARRKMGFYSYLTFKPCIKLKIISRVDKKIMLMGERRLNIAPHCVNVLRELRLSVWDENKVEPTPVDRNNHTLDALDYAITGWWKNLNSNLTNTKNLYNGSKMVVGR